MFSCHPLLLGLRGLDAHLVLAAPDLELVHPTGVGGGEIGYRGPSATFSPTTMKSGSLLSIPALCPAGACAAIGGGESRCSAPPSARWLERLGGTADATHVRLPHTASWPPPRLFLSMRSDRDDRPSPSLI